LEWPAECLWRPFPNTAACGEPLTISGVQDGESVRKPIRPFLVQDFDEFIGKLLSQPGMEEILDQGTVLNCEHDLWDIKDGEAIRSLKGPDGRPFMDGLKRSELRLVWSLSVDWFNPFHNKAAGRKASCGSIAMMLLNLPPSLRYKTENIYPHGIIPGPKEPSLDKVNHFISPLVHQLDNAYEHGTWFSRTFQHLEGRKTRSAVAVNIFDLPGARKITGMANYNSKSFFCMLCTLPRSAINDIDWMKWTPRDVDLLREAAERWRDAPSASKRNEIFEEFGVRWSEMWRLRYYNPIQSVIVDGMHALLLGLVQFHCRNVLGIDRSSFDDSIADPKQLAKCRTILASNPTRTQLSKFTNAVLKQICDENNVKLPVLGDDGKYTKEELVNALRALIVSFDLVAIHFVANPFN
jgi:hypothetical protein